MVPYERPERSLEEIMIFFWAVRLLPRFRRAFTVNIFTCTSFIELDNASFTMFKYTQKNNNKRYCTYCVLQLVNRSLVASNKGRHQNDGWHWCWYWRWTNDVVNIMFRHCRHVGNNEVGAFWICFDHTVIMPVFKSRRVARIYIPAWMNLKIHQSIVRWISLFQRFNQK